MSEEISKFVSLILRHKPEVINIKLDEHGWADVNDLIHGICKKRPDFKLDASILADIVKNDSKQRYSFNNDHTKIRANQGHSFDVDLDLKSVMPPEILYHGTAERFTNSIDVEGLRHMSRQYVHLSTDISTALTVGARHGTPVVYEVRAKDMYRTGYTFFLSKNGVWLIDNVPVRFINKLHLAGEA